MDHRFDPTPLRPGLQSPIDDPVELPRRRGGMVVLVIIILMVLGGGGFFGWTMYSRSVQRTKRAETELRAARQKLGEASKRETLHKTTLATQETELAALRTIQSEVGPTRFSGEQGEALAKKLRDALGEIRGTVTNARGRVTLDLEEEAIFESGKAEITEEGGQLLAKVGEMLKSSPGTQAWVQAHTSKRRPRDKKAFPSNWELSAGQANAVVRYLDDEANVDPERLVAVGFASYRPAPSGASARIEIAIFPIEPPPPAPAAASAAPSASRPSGGAPPRRRSAPREKKSDTGLGSL